MEVLKTNAVVFVRNRGVRHGRLGRCVAAPHSRLQSAGSSCARAASSLGVLHGSGRVVYLGGGSARLHGGSNTSHTSRQAAHPAAEVMINLMGIVWGSRIRLSEFKFLDFLKTDHCESICGRCRSGAQGAKGPGSLGTRESPRVF